MMKNSTLCVIARRPLGRRGDLPHSGVFGGLLRYARNDSLFVVAILSIILIASCTPRNAGQLTLVNSGVETAKISIDGRTFTVFPSNHITKEVSAGARKIKVNDGPEIGVNVTEGLTTLFDTTGLSCYIVADFSQTKRGGNPLILERFEKVQSFTTGLPMMTVLGSVFPKKPEKGKPFTRIHQIDCEIVNNNSEIIDEIEEFP